MALRQERRRFPGDPMWHEDRSLAVAVQRIEREVEALCGVPVEAVTVGDCELDEDLAALVDAAREATINAAKWSGASVISLFAEVESAEVSGLRPRPWQGLRSRRGRARPQGPERVDPRPDGAPRRHLERPLRLRDGNRGRARHAPRPQAPADVRTVTPRVFLVDDHQLFRAGVRAEIGGEVEVVGEADDVAPAVELICERVPDVVLLDVHLPAAAARRWSRR